MRTCCIQGQRRKKRVLPCQLWHIRARSWTGHQGVHKQHKPVTSALCSFRRSTMATWLVLSAQSKKILSLYFGSLVHKSSSLSLDSRALSNDIRECESFFLRLSACWDNLQPLLTLYRNIQMDGSCKWRHHLSYMMNTICKKKDKKNRKKKKKALRIAQWHWLLHRNQLIS